MPDGRVIKVGAERFEASEALFNPGLVDGVLALQSYGVHCWAAQLEMAVALGVSFDMTPCSGWPWNAPDDL